MPSKEGAISASLGKPITEAELANKPRYWMGDPPDRCDLNPSHKIEDTFVDGATDRGPWANMCPKCHRAHGRGIGQGQGQRYEKREVEGRTRWLKTAG